MDRDDSILRSWIQGHKRALVKVRLCQEPFDSQIHEIAKNQCVAVGHTSYCTLKDVHIFSSKIMIDVLPKSLHCNKKYKFEEPCISF